MKSKKHQNAVGRMIFLYTFSAIFFFVMGSFGMALSYITEENPATCALLSVACFLIGVLYLYHAVSLKRVVRRILRAKTLYVIEDKTTGMPFLSETDAIFVFCRQKRAARKLAAMDPGGSRRLAEIHKAETQGYLYRAFYLQGAKSCCVDYGKDTIDSITVPAGALVRPVDDRGPRGADCPVRNPDLLRALTKLVQEQRSPCGYAEKEETLQRYLLAADEAFRTAKLLVPIRKLPEDELERHGRYAVIKKAAAAAIPMIAAGPADAKLRAMPVFTDWYAFQKVFAKEQFDGWICGAEDILSMSADTIVINPGGIRYEWKSRCP